MSATVPAGNLHSQGKARKRREKIKSKAKNKEEKNMEEEEIRETRRIRRDYSSSLKMFDFLLLSSFCPFKNILFAYLTDFFLFNIELFIICFCSYEALIFLLFSPIFSLIAGIRFLFPPPHSRVQNQAPLPSLLRLYTVISPRSHHVDHRNQNQTDPNGDLSVRSIGSHKLHLGYYGSTPLHV